MGATTKDIDITSDTNTGVPMLELCVVVLLVLCGFVNTFSPNNDADNSITDTKTLIDSDEDKALGNDKLIVEDDAGIGIEIIKGADVAFEKVALSLLGGKDILDKVAFNKEETNDRD